MSSLIAVDEEERVTRVDKGAATRTVGYLCSLTVSRYQ